MSGIVNNTGARSGIIGHTVGGVDHSTLFRAYTGSGQGPTMTHTTWTKMLFATKTYDIGSNFSTSNSEYTVPSSGYYTFISQVGFYSGNLTNCMLNLYINGSSGEGTSKGVTGRAELRISNMSYFMQHTNTSYYAAGDTVRVYGYIEESGSVSSSLYTNDGLTFFSGYKVAN